MLTIQSKGKNKTLRFKEKLKELLTKKCPFISLKNKTRTKIVFKWSEI